MVSSDRGPGDTHAAGLQARREVLGEEHVARSLARTSPVGEAWLEHAHRHAWGAVWTRPGLDRRMRSAITLASLTALHLDREVALHTKAAIGNGLTPEEIVEIVIHTSIYAGFPAAHEALAAVEAALAEIGEGA